MLTTNLKIALVVLLLLACAGFGAGQLAHHRSNLQRLLRGERCVRSVANLTRRDGEEFLALAPRVPVRTTVQTFPLSQANEALTSLRQGQVRGAAVLIPDSPAPVG
jgi:alcohol dehydrogenase, propanol-preferring